MKDHKIWPEAAALLNALRMPGALSWDIRKAGRRLFGIAGSGDVDSDITFGTAATYDVDDDPTLAADSDDLVPTQAAVKAYADQLIAANDAMVYKGVVDCSANPNYPPADCGWTYRVSVAGKIGGGSGPNVQVGDILLCLTDATASGNHATVGANWDIIQTNIDGALTTASIGSTVQAKSDNLQAIADQTPAADRLTYWTGSTTVGLATFTAWGRSLVDDANQAAAQTTLGLVPTTSNADLTAGRMLKVGDYGLGSALSTSSATPFSTHYTTSGFIHSPSTSNTPSDWPASGESWYGITVNTPAGQRGAQLLVGHSSGRSFVRGHASATYTSWYEMVQVARTQTLTNKTLTDPVINGGTITITSDYFKSTGAYAVTTANAANVNVASDGTLARSTSSERYKRDIEPVDLEFARRIIMGSQPIWYRSTCERDNPDYSWWGLSAEAMARIDPRLVHWKTHEMVTVMVDIIEDRLITVEKQDAVTGEWREVGELQRVVTGQRAETRAVALAEPVPDGVAYERLTVHLIAIAQEQARQIDAVMARMDALAARLEQLTGPVDV